MADKWVNRRVMNGSVVKHYLHEDGRECWQQEGGWRFRAPSGTADGCERRHDAVSG